MSKKIIINLPVADLQKAIDFYTAIGLTNNPQGTDATAASMILTEEIYVMLLTHPKFKEFTKKEIGDTVKTASVFNSLAVNSGDEVNTMVENALKAGAKETNEPEDYGFMQSRSFEDLDGHLWGILYMDVTKLPQ